MKSVNDLFLSCLLKYGRVIGFILVWGGSVAIFCYLARAGFLYGTESNYSFPKAILIAALLALIATIGFFSAQFYNVPEVIGIVGVAIICLSVGGMIFGVSLGGHWGMSAKIFGMVVGLLFAAAPFLIQKRMQKRL